MSMYPVSLCSVCVCTGRTIKAILFPLLGQRRASFPSGHRGIRSSATRRPVAHRCTHRQRSLNFEFIRSSAHTAAAKTRGPRRERKEGVLSSATQSQHNIIDTLLVCSMMLLRRPPKERSDEVIFLDTSSSFFFGHTNEFVGRTNRMQRHTHNVT